MSLAILSGVCSVVLTAVLITAYQNGFLDDKDPFETATTENETDPLWGRLSREAEQTFGIIVLVGMLVVIVIGIFICILVKKHFGSADGHSTKDVSSLAPSSESSDFSDDDEKMPLQSLNTKPLDDTFDEGSDAEQVVPSTADNLLPGSVKETSEVENINVLNKGTDSDTDTRVIAPVNSKDSHASSDFPAPVKAAVVSKESLESSDLPAPVTAPVVSKDSHESSDLPAPVIAPVIKDSHESSDLPAPVIAPVVSKESHESSDLPAPHAPGLNAPSVDIDVHSAAPDDQVSQLSPADHHVEDLGSSAVTSDTQQIEEASHLISDKEPKM